MQLGSFSRKDNADRLVTELSAKGFSAYLLPTTQAGKEAFEIGYRSVKGPPDEWFMAATFRFGHDASAAMRDVTEMVKRRGALQPLGLPSCGSVFRNPTGDHAGRLIEAAGLKGLRVGGAVVSDKHANFIINDAHATAADIEALIERVRETVRAETGISLETEVRIVGERMESEVSR